MRMGQTRAKGDDDMVEETADRPANDERAAKTEEKRQKRAEELVVQIDGLRATLNEMIDRYRSRIEGDLSQVAAVARGENGKRFSSASTEKMLEELQHLRLKPHKGRGKDFDRLQELVDDLVEHLPHDKG